MKKKQTRTKVLSSKKRWGLEVRTYAKNIQHYVDMDYIDELSEEEKDWLNIFSEEYYGNTFREKKKSLNKNKKARQDCYNRYNARQRDISNQRIKSSLDESYHGKSYDSTNSMVDWIDSSKNIEKKLKKTIKKFTDE